MGDCYFCNFIIIFCHYYFIVYKLLLLTHDPFRDKMIDGLISFSNPEGDKGVIQLSAKMRMYEDLVEHGVQDLLQREYGDCLSATPEVILL
jgi:hypothetical protein